MTAIKNISIRQACHQSWKEMTINTEGRHCAHCCKTVVDFTRMTNDEIIGYLSSGDHICGRFENYRLNGLNNHLAGQNESRYSWKGFAACLSLMLALPLAKTEAKPRYHTQQPMAINAKKSANIQPDSTLVTRVQGNIIDRSDRVPLPGVIITIKGTQTGTVTNVSGKFVLNSKIGEVLVISFVGYERQEILVREANQQINLELNEISQILGAPVISEIKRPSIHKTIWYKIKRLFR